ncbi:cytochrome c [Xanthobacter autotrophicus]|uniref:c-type cytochrome n=1 Tax=Xanthobacter TaxID=279 RepID=UPI0024AAD785|nr:c-type cytochrome [Xanthobacter autotrophicus]MDI4663179.1 cytochrome c [Xanthobacter autotrophicus]
MRTSVIALALMLVGVPTSSHADVKRGGYLATIMDCGGCHTPGSMLGKPDMSRVVAGGDVGFQIPDAGIFFPPNLTPDDETGLGRWSTAEIVRAITKGVRPDGRMLAPIMPWHSYSRLTPQDAMSLALYLKSLKPISNKVPAITGPGEKPAGLYMTVISP